MVLEELGHGKEDLEKNGKVVFKWGFFMKFGKDCLLVLISEVGDVADGGKVIVRKVLNDRIIDLEISSKLIVDELDECFWWFSMQFGSGLVHVLVQPFCKGGKAGSGTFLSLGVLGLVGTAGY